MTATDSVGAARAPVTLAPFDRRAWVVAGLTTAVLLALADRYGYHRDELYFLDAARHLQGGYVDQPVFTPLVAWASLHLFGLSLVGLRAWSALAAGVTVVVGALTARELGGDRTAQLLSALGVATMPALLAADHLLETTSFDILAWVGLAFFVVRVGRTGDPRWWVPAGLVLGLGLTNKHSVGLFAIALVASIALGSGRRILASRWFALGAAVAVLFTLPDVVWQAQHGWPTIAMTHVLEQENGGLGNLPSWIVGQLLIASPALVGVWVVGLRRLWRSGVPVWRALTSSYLVLFVVFGVTSGSKIYYLAGLYPALLAAGMVPLGERWARGTHRRLVATWALATAVAACLTLPVLPASTAGWYYGLNSAPAETVGWPQLVRTVDQVWWHLPAASRDHAVIMTADYGEAGAVTELGRADHLPAAVSGQNNEWFWGPGNPNATTVVWVTPGPRDGTGFGAYFDRYFRTVLDVATLSNPDGVHNQEWHGHVWVLTGLRERWGSLWARLRHYS